MKIIIPKKLARGDEIRVIALSQSMAIVNNESKKAADKCLSGLGLKVTLGKHVNETDIMQSSSIESRIEDLHSAFADPKVKGIFTAIGGYNCNQLLKYIDWDLIKKNPKIFCGYSDITALNNAILAKTGLVTFSGPHYSTFGRQYDNEYTIEYFIKCIMQDEDFEIVPSIRWDDRKWYINQKDRTSFKNESMIIINKGSAEGTIVGGNLATFGLLKGTEYFPSLNNSILFIEDCDSSADPVEFDRNLQAFIHLPEFSGVRGIVIGRFEINSKMTKKTLAHIIKTKKELDNIPVIANADFGHTDPKFTFPIGGKAKISADEESKIEIINSDYKLGGKDIINASHEKR